MIKLSIITINYNNDCGLQKTIESIANQLYSNYEFIVIDGGSTDKSLEIIKKFIGNITYWVSEKDNGIYNAMNKGIQKANGEYCLFLNSGDYLVDSNVLNKVFESNYSADILYGDMMIDWGNGALKLGKMPEEISVFQMYIDTLWHPVSFIKKHLFDKFGLYDENYKMVADYEFFFRTIIKNKVSTQHLHFPISIFVADGLSSLPENKEIEIAERTKVIKKYLSESEIALLEKNIKKTGFKKPSLLSRFIKKLNK